MLLQAVPPPIPPPPPPGLVLENEIILLMLGIVYGIIVLYKRRYGVVKELEVNLNKIRRLGLSVKNDHSPNETCN